jgi:glycine cleavage system aminomethyltransferase T
VAELLSAGETEWDMRDCDAARFERHAHSRPYVQARGWSQYDEVYDILHPLQQLENPRPLRTSPFYPRQQALGAVFYEGRGWERPQWYEANARLNDGTLSVGALSVERSTSDVERSTLNAQRRGWEARGWSPISVFEHLATRERVALFDMTSLPRVDVTGPGAAKLLEHLTSSRVDRPVGSVVYTCMLNARGGIRSDVTVARLAEDRFQVGCNGPSDVAWLRKHLPADGSAQVRDIGPGTCCIGVWGPLARALVQPLTDADLSNATFPYFACRELFIGEVPVVALRVSYVGELGWELYTSADYGLRLWDLLWRAGEPLGVVAAGRAAFDALRVEKGYRLWGLDMHSEHTPFEAGLGFTVKLDKGEFRGREALVRAKADGPRRKLCCLTFDDPQHIVLGKEPVFADGQIAGYVTSAAFGASVGKSIAYAWLPAEHSTPGMSVEVEYFGTRYPATIAPDPLWDPKGARLRV